MSRSFNTLKTSDVTTTPIKLKYTASYDSSSLSDYGIMVLTGTNNPISISGSDSQETINYRTFRHLYYSNYLTGSFPISSSAAFNWEQSTAASGTVDADLRYFPTESGQKISILSIPRSLYGEKISRGSFTILPKSSYDYHIVDDGNGNLVDIGSNTTYVDADYFNPIENPITGYVGGPPKNTHVGNIMYSQGIAIITNQDYIDVLKSTATVLTLKNLTTTVDVGQIYVNRQVIRGIPPNSTATLYSSYVPAPRLELKTGITDVYRKTYAVKVTVDKGYLETRTTNITADPGESLWLVDSPAIPLGSLVEITVSIANGGHGDVNE